MSLDQNLFTLNITPRIKEPHIIELVDPSETVHYRKERTDEGGYSFNLYDPMSGSLLATTTAPNAASKQKIIELHNPSAKVELKFTGTFTFRWTFQWEEHEFEWKREECHILRKPDPSVMIAVTRESPGRIKSKAVQILDYNLNRFEIQDRKGLEIVLLAALLSFQDYSDDYHAPKKEETTPNGTPLPTPPPAKANSKMIDAPPERPPKNIKTGVERVAELQRGDLNEISVEEESEIEDYAQYCVNLLEGDHMLFVTLRSTSAATVPKVLQVAHQTKRIWHHTGSDQELSQYVLYDTESNITSPGGKKAPRIIKLDDDTGKDKYKPPESLTVHLSRIPMPELQPKVSSAATGKKDHEVSDKRKSTDKRKENEKEKSKGKSKVKAKDDSLFRRGRTNSESSAEGAMNAVPKLHHPDANKLRHRSSYSNIPSHLAHPKQPSPSPSQLNNPQIYSAPPPHQSSFRKSFYGSGTVTSGPGKKADMPRPTSVMYGGSWGPSPVLGAHNGGDADQRPSSSVSLVSGLFDKLRTR